MIKQSLEITQCPKCQANKNILKSGVIKGQQRYKCKQCGYHFTVDKEGKSIESYYVIKALQLYLEGISTREIERLLGVSHVSVLNWIKKYNCKVPKGKNIADKPSYGVYTRQEIVNLFQDKDFLKNAGMIINELGDKYIVIKWMKRLSGV